jgi:hypothetical protein
LLRTITKSLSAFSVLTMTVILGASAATAASQNASNSADSAAANASLTKQSGDQGQNANSSSGNSGCWEFCTGGGGNLTLQSQSLGQAAFTGQWAESAALAKQNAVNANVPVTIAGKGKVGSSPSSANQWADNSANSNATNASATKQDADQNQNANSNSGNSGCSKFCTGGGGNITKQGQDLAQLAATHQSAASAALAKQNAVNANVPVTIVGIADHGSGKDGWGSDGWGNSGKSSGANQNASNSASSAAANASVTHQDADQNQNSNASSGNSGGGGKFSAGGGGNITPQSQDLVQLAKTQQGSISAAVAGQLATNGASPVSIGG